MTTADSIILNNVEPFSLLSPEGLNLVQAELKNNHFEIGERIYREDETPSVIHYIVKGEARVLVKPKSNSILTTAGKIGSGEIIGWVGLLRGESCETIQVCDDLETLSISSGLFVKLCCSEHNFLNYFNTKFNLSEAWITLERNLEIFPLQSDLIDKAIRKGIEIAKVTTSIGSKNDKEYILSSNYCNKPVGTRVDAHDDIKVEKGLIFPPRVIEISKRWKESLPEDSQFKKANNMLQGKTEDTLSVDRTDLYKLGIIEYEDQEDVDKYPVITGNGIVNEGVAVIEMITRRFKLPMRKELCKDLEQQKQRGKRLSLENIGGLWRL